MVPELRDRMYEDRSIEMELPTLQDRRERGDLVILHKMALKAEHAGPGGYERRNKIDEKTFKQD